MKHIKKTMAFILILVLCLGMLPTSAFAAGKGIFQTESIGKADTSSSPKLTFSSDSPFTLKTKNGIKNWNGTLEYSYDDTVARWIIWDGTTTLKSKNVNGREILFLRGTGNTRISTRADKGWVLTGSRIACRGNIETILDYRTVAAGHHPPMADRCFASLFYKCAALIEAPELPAEVMTNYCYYRMFCKCTSLIAAPELPALKLADHCYDGMFLCCESLKYAPELRATIMKDSCYMQMFSGCSSLVTVQRILPARELAKCCYKAMYSGSYIQVAPVLPAMTLEPQCYANMFDTCENLERTPALPATELAEFCYFRMFGGCTVLSYIPALPATYLPKGCYQRMFNGCVKIRLSANNFQQYTTPYSIPINANATYAHPTAVKDMFLETGGYYIPTPQVNRTYYLHSNNSIVWP